MIEQLAQPHEHIIDMPALPPPARPLSENVVDEIHGIIHNFMDSVDLTSVLYSGNVRSMLNRELSGIANRSDLHRLGLDSYPHVELTSESLAVTRIERELSYALQDFIPIVNDCGTRHGAVRPLRELAWKSLVQTEVPSELADTMQLHLPNSNQAPTEAQTATLHAIIDKSQTNDFHTALAQVLRESGAESSRDAVFAMGRGRLRHRQIVHASSSAGLTAGMLAIAAPTVFLGAWTRRLWLSGDELSSAHDLAYTQRRACFTQKIESCPIVPISRVSLGPQKACADAAQTACNEQFPIPHSNGVGYYAGSLGAGYVTLCYGGGAIAGVGSMVPEVFSESVNAMRATFLLWCFPKNAATSTSMRRRLTSFISRQYFLSRNRPLAERLHHD